MASEDEGRIRYELLEPERDQAGALLANRGLLALPEPAAGDLFFDIEGARYYSEDSKEFGLQYLFGIVDTADTDARGRPRYTQIWAFDRADEKRAFEELIDFITERRRRHPGLHVYHYNHYEPTSVDHLTELHGTRQEAVGLADGPLRHPRGRGGRPVPAAACSSTCTGWCGRAYGRAWRATRSSGWSRCAATPGRWTCGRRPRT